VARGTASSGPYTTIYSTTDWTTPHYTDTAVANGTTYYYVVSALNQAGGSANSASASAAPLAGSGLPAGWSQASIGAAGAGIEAKYADVANGSFYLGAYGVRIGGTADACTFIYKSVTGDITLTARLTDRRGIITKMGIMMRDSISPGAKAFAITLGEIGGRQARFGTRASLGGVMTNQLGDDYTWLPVWFRLQRVGNTVTAFQSSDGATWFPVGVSTVALPKTILIGLAASSDNMPIRNSGVAAFDNVNLGVTAPSPPAAPTALAASAPSGSEIRLTWQNNSTTQTGFRIEESVGNALFYEIADLTGSATSFINTGLSNPAIHQYRVRAYNTGGYSAYSNVAGLPVAKPLARISP
jgi:hypothetical protein